MSIQVFNLINKYKWINPNLVQPIEKATKKQSKYSSKDT